MQQEGTGAAAQQQQQGEAAAPAAKRVRRNTLGVGGASGRPWKQPAQRASSGGAPQLKSTWEKKMRLKAEASAFRSAKQEARQVGCRWCRGEGRGEPNRGGAGGAAVPARCGGARLGRWVDEQAVAPGARWRGGLPTHVCLPPLPPCQPASCHHQAAKEKRDAVRAKKAAAVARKEEARQRAAVVTPVTAATAKRMLKSKKQRKLLKTADTVGKV